MQKLTALGVYLRCPIVNTIYYEVVANICFAGLSGLLETITSEWCIGVHCTHSTLYLTHLGLARNSSSSSIKHVLVKVDVICILQLIFSRVLYSHVFFRSSFGATFISCITLPRLPIAYCHGRITRDYLMEIIGAQDG
jgi:hypothetical protein